MTNTENYTKPNNKYNFDTSTLVFGHLPLCQSGVKHQQHEQAEGGVEEGGGHLGWESGGHRREHLGEESVAHRSNLSSSELDFSTTLKS